MHLAWVFVEKWPQVLRRPRRLSPPEVSMAASAAQATRIGFARCPKAQNLDSYTDLGLRLLQKLRFCDSSINSESRALAQVLSGRGFGVMCFRALAPFRTCRCFGGFCRSRVTPSRQALRVRSCRSTFEAAPVVGPPRPKDAILLRGLGSSLGFRV